MTHRKNKGESCRENPIFHSPDSFVVEGEQREEIQGPDSHNLKHLKERQTRKRKRNLGTEYTTASGKCVPKQKTSVPCDSDVCKAK